ncbi:MAG TPA: histidine phosphatase family protein [Bacteroidales bacterium]|nr:histidine phosphatase family protein [Bacteroidales bacterium]
MKKIIFIRHGKAEAQPPEISDFERSLSLKGKIISRKMAARLKAKENIPGLFITSPAFRALETALIFAEEFGVEPEKILLSSNLYYKMSFQYLHKLTSLINEEINSITLFGHNPSFTEIPNILSKEGSGFLPKSGIIGISFNITTWSEIKRNSGTLEYFLKPEKTL